MLQLRKVFWKIRKSFLNLKIGTKILIFYFGVLIFSVILSSILYQNIYNKSLSSKVSEVSVQTLYSINSNIESMMENSKNLSKVIIASNEIQQPLNSKKLLSPKNTVDLESQRIINTHLSKFIEAFPFISSIYIFDNNSQRYGIDKMPLKSLKVNDIKEVDWYTAALNAQGGYILRLNAGGLFTEIQGEKYISLIRIINDLYTQKPIGVLIINISGDSFADSYKEIINKYDTDIMIIDGNGETIVNFKHMYIYKFGEILNKKLLYSNTLIKKIEGRNYLVSYLNIPKYDWNIISTMPFQELSKESAYFSIAAFAIITLNSLLIFLGSILVSRMITTPIKKLLKSMKGIEKGEFKKVDIPAGNDEIGQLRDGYNIMITQIQNLIDRVVEEQKIKRKAELDVLQAQIKPHFLYNTFDAISSLALSGESKEVYKVMKALGSYYRTSLSKGSEVITILEEIDVVRNYLTIQQVRYGDIFTTEYEIDERLSNFKILKLVLQPLVENALYHGIRPNNDQGKIRICIKQLENIMVLTIEDNGVGMDDDTIQLILEGQPQSDKKASFGLRGTIERLRIFYGVNEPVSIESKVGYGTKIIISIPIEGESLNG